VLRKLVDDPTLEGITHVLVDEVHERQWQIDVLLISLRTLLSGSRPDLKVVLVSLFDEMMIPGTAAPLPLTATNASILSRQMSATLDAELFCSYFGGAPFVAVPGRTFPVVSYYLEDLLEETGHVIEEGSYCARRDVERKRESSTLWVTTRGGEKRRETHCLGRQPELCCDYEGYSLSTQR
jgi:hypothetical protein